MVANVITQLEDLRFNAWPKNWKKNPNRYKTKGSEKEKAYQHDVLRNQTTGERIYSEYYTGLQFMQ